VYADLLRERLEANRCTVWLVNTGWSGGPYGVGHRMKIAHTRAMVTAILDGRLRDVETTPHPIFGVHVPRQCPGVPANVLDPRETWADKAAYDAAAVELQRRFEENYAGLKP
jgi:phosphoenolpyruvate carboxykinase (ATP)